MDLISFNEAFYLANNADVAEAVARGEFASGEEHYNLFGDAEQRDPNAFFDVNFYLASNPDVVSALQTGGLTTTLQHYEEFGASELRPNVPDPNLFFDADFYLAENPDVAQAIADGSFGNPNEPEGSAFGHFALLGALEGRVPNANSTNDFVLTIGPDNFTGGNQDTQFFAPSAVGVDGGLADTFQSQDVINGNGGNNTIIATIGLGEPVTTANIQNTQNLVLTDNAPGGTTTFDFSIASGITNITDENSNNGGGLLLQDLQELLAPDDAITLINPVAAHDLAVTFDDSLVTGSDDSISVDLFNVIVGVQPMIAAGGNTNAISINASGQFAGGFETINLTSGGSATNLVDAIGSDPTALFASPFSFSNASVATTLNVDGTADLMLGVIPQPLVIPGGNPATFPFAAAIVQTNIDTIDGSALEADLSIVIDPLLDVTATGGIGNDAFHFVGVAPGTGLDDGDVVDFGEGDADVFAVQSPWGVDTVQVTGADVAVLWSGHVNGGGATYDVGALDTGVDPLDILAVWNNGKFVGAGAAITLDDVDNDTVVALSGTPGAPQVAGGVGGTPDIGGVTITYADDTVADSVNLEIGRSAGATPGAIEELEVAGLVIADVEEISINSVGDSSPDPVTGAGANTIRGTTFPDIEQLNVTGTADLAFETFGGVPFAVGGTTIAIVDASTFEGGLDIFVGPGDGVAGNGVVISGGSGDDRLIGNANDDTISGGAGDDDLIGGAGNDDIVGGDGADNITGGIASDNLTGGGGSDQFLYHSSLQFGALTSGNFTAVVTPPNTFVTANRAADVIIDFSSDEIALNVGTFGTGSITSPGPTGATFLAGTLFSFLFQFFSTGGGATFNGSAIPVIFGNSLGVTGTKFVMATSSATTSIGGLFNSQASANAFASFLVGLSGLNPTVLGSRSFLAFGVNTAQNRLFVAVASENAGAFSNIDDVISVFTVAVGSFGSLGDASDIVFV